jgi:DNA-directed RNA polymerase subunit alpha
MITPKDVRIKKEKDTKDLGRFSIGPLPSGYGHTLGNALRRVLLSSLPGAAIAEVRFSGVSHPFTTIKGVKEDVIELILNLKKVRLTMHVDEPLEATIEAKGKKVVTAGDIKIGSGAEVVNPDLKIATLTDKSAKISARLLVERGVGYKPSEEREGSKVGVIPMDSVFSPVARVAYQVEEARRGRETDLDRIVMEVVTDGTIKPSAAVEQAASILVSYFGLLSGEKPKKSESVSVDKEVPGLSPKVRKQPLSELDLSTQTETILKKAGVKSIGGLLGKSEKGLLDIKGFGKRRVGEVKRELKKLGAVLKEG